MKRIGLFTLILAGLFAGFAVATSAAPEDKPELPKTGINLARDDGGWINVGMDGVSFVVTFFNNKKKQVAADVDHGLVRYSYVAKPKDRTVLTLSPDGMKLISPSTVKPPHIFRVHMALFDRSSDDLAETFAFSFQEN